MWNKPVGMCMGVGPLDFGGTRPQDNGSRDPEPTQATTPRRPHPMSPRPEANGKGCSAPGPGSRTCCHGVTVRFDEKSAEQERSFPEEQWRFPGRSPLSSLCPLYSPVGSHPSAENPPHAGTGPRLLLCLHSADKESGLELRNLGSGWPAR